MTGLHKEVSFETHICARMAAAGWLHAEGDAAHYDRARALFAPDVVAWVQASQPQAWEALSKTHGAGAEAMLLDRIRRQLDDRGTLDVLRFGVELTGLRAPVRLAQFRPALKMNADLLALHAANRLRVVRQLRYSRVNENSIDLVLVLNGLPIATAELKTDFTQGVQDAVDQYRFDRLPAPKGQPPEPLLSFPGGALVHFAVSDSEVMMTTRLDGAATRFLAAPKDKRFAVIADEAHSSQTGQAAAKLKEVLSAEEVAALDDGGEVSTEDLLAAQMSE